MGHDITAYKLDAARRNIIHKALYLEEYDADDWVDRFEQYKQETEIAHIRRAAWNPLNSIIYLALNAEDFNNGVSGSGESRSFTREELKLGLKWLQGVQQEGVQTLSRRRNMIDDIAQMFGGQEATKEVPMGDDIDQEIEFVEKCLEWMDEHGLQTLSIEFG